MESCLMARPESVEELVVGLHFEQEVIMLCVRWYSRFKLSLRDLVAMMNERGLSLALTTIMRWVQRYMPEFEKRGDGSARRWVRLGWSTRPTSKFEASGVTSNAPLTEGGGRSTSG
jgi:hypothetical protein